MVVLQPADFRDGARNANWCQPCPVVFRLHCYTHMEEQVHLQRNTTLMTLRVCCLLGDFMSSSSKEEENSTSLVTLFEGVILVIGSPYQYN